MIQVALPELVVEKLQAVADREGSELADVLAEAVEQYIALSPPVRAQADKTDMPAWKVRLEEQKRRIDAEQKKYEAQHPELFQRYAGQYIAMYQGEVVDSGVDDAELSRRIRSRFGNTPVLITPVLKEPIQTFVVRSPRLAQE
ncbi:MAG: hypothetical protein KJZ86_15805 [Caldilineaceae bacterium]|nr:hypothetical protein [Caldilineaceae bacterium]HRJ41535.1 DUF5678 domain-containing protein [Caldilineaceae bacterium]